jgi:hypothetical protein
MTLHPLAGGISVDASAGRIRQYRWLEERLMRTLGGWIALTPELPIKLLFGRHVWDCAQHADLWGRRLPELRATAHQGEPPNDGFARLVARIDGLQARHESLERVVAVYRLLKPHLIGAYESDLNGANPIYEPPTRRILVRCLDEERRHVAAADVILGRVPDSERSRMDAWERELCDELTRVGGIAPPEARMGKGDRAPDPRGDLVALDSAFDPAVIDSELAGVLEMHGRAVADGDVEALSAQVTADARAGVIDLYRAMEPGATATVVACARIGAYRIVKLALRGRLSVSIVQLEWRRSEVGWRIVRGELVRSEPTG